MSEQNWTNTSICFRKWQQGVWLNLSSWNSLKSNFKFTKKSDSLMATQSSIKHWLNTTSVFYLRCILILLLLIWEISWEFQPSKLKVLFQKWLVSKEFTAYWTNWTKLLNLRKADSNNSHITHKSNKFVQMQTH